MVTAVFARTSFLDHRSPVCLNQRRSRRGAEASPPANRGSVSHHRCLLSRAARAGLSDLGNVVIASHRQHPRRVAEADQSPVVLRKLAFTTTEFPISVDWQWLSSQIVEAGLKTLPLRPQLV